MSDSECPACVLKFEDTVDLGKRLCSFIKDRYDESVKDHGKFHIAVSGGSLPKFMKGLSKREDIEWARWWIYFCDERYVKHDDVDSNYGALKEVLLSQVPIPEEQILKLNPEAELSESAREYQQELTSRLPSLELDLTLCGMGPDGHTCSLFPGHDLLNEQTLLIAPITDSPKPPPSRITMTYPLLNKSRNVAFVVTGESKVPMVVSALHDPLDKACPAGRVRPTSGNLYWFLDNKAAAGLPEENKTS